MSAADFDLGFMTASEALKVFEDLGREVEDVEVGWTFAAHDAWYTLWESASWGLKGELYPRWKFEMDPFVREILERGQRHSAGRTYRCQAVRGEIYKTLGPILERHDVLPCPTTAAPSIPADHDVEDTDFRINGKPLTVSNRPGDIYVQWQLCYPFNLVPECPAATVPSGFAANGPPTGLQIVGSTYDDLSVFRAARAYQEVYQWRRFRPPL